ncbi:hypothetical protein BDV33DRAFT_184710 [Aspergillus novoparasiticus]|uniref:Uncharacterized protein n=1 Tax=Aspergillus novoparasiticus TaxID=986946 RepID=A0A5N6E9K8_9EURO|nr:hypothetical protein BDV33DRAFT_184710 [Aspergillus novoparasiticus]
MNSIVSTPAIPVIHCLSFPAAVAIFMVIPQFRKHYPRLTYEQCPQLARLLLLR